ncbi:MAG TPA: response regulator [Ktedonobacteraceae bacterium]|nr:response regulator [Ktedonobacteraceae bacterium]
MQTQQTASNTHEQLLQELSTMLLQLNTLQTLVRDDVPDINGLRRGLTDLEQRTRSLIAEIRSADEQLPSADLAGATLSEALTRLVEETAETLGLASRVAFSGDERPLPAYTENLLYRIAQEALFQVRQHTNARRLRLALSYGRDEVQMNIEDDGVLPSSGEEIPVPHFRSEEQNNSGSLHPYSDLRHRLDHLGGSLNVTTDVEKGTQVQARIPYATPAGAQALAPSPVAIAANPPGPHIHVLVVDNQAVSRAGLRHLLASYPDLEVVGEAADGLQAVSETLELGPQVVLMDANLPNGQSMEALKQIKQLNLDTRVLLLSAQEREEYLYETLRAGADGYVLKDIAPDELAQAVRTVAGGEVLVQPQLAGRLLSRFGRQGRGGYLYEPLTTREQEVLQLLARGLRNKEIAARLYVSERTVNFHLANIYHKLNVSGRTEALSKALEQGLIGA